MGSNMEFSLLMKFSLLSSETYWFRPCAHRASPISAPADEPIPDSNIGNVLLRRMGWRPGTGLGAARSGIVEPVSATLRPRRRGLGAVASGWR
jgi:hypothetical protein